MGRTGAPFGANYYGVTPDMITAPRRSATAFRYPPCCCRRRVAERIKYDDMGTTFGGGPMACAAVEAVIETIESESLLANVRQVSDYIRAHCIIGPVTGVQGAGLPARPQDLPARQGSAGGAARAGHSDGHERRSERAAPAARLHLERRARRHPARRPVEDFRVKRFLDLADFDREEILDLLSLAQSLEEHPPGPVARRQGPRPGIFQSVAAHLGLLPGRHGAARRHLLRDHARTGNLAARDPHQCRHGRRRGRALREGIPVLASYCDALGVRAFAEGKNLKEDLHETLFRMHRELCDKPLINLESAMNHPCQALADWRTLDELEVPQRAKFVLCWIYHPHALPLAVPAAVVHMAAMRGMEVVVARPEASRCRGEVMDKARRRARASGGSVTETDGSRRGAQGRARRSTPRNGAARRTTAMPRPMRALRADLKDWCVRETWFSGASPGRQAHALLAGAPQRRRRRRSPGWRARRGQARGSQSLGGTDGRAASHARLPPFEQIHGVLTR